MKENNTITTSLLIIVLIMLINTVVKIYSLNRVYKTNSGVVLSETVLVRASIPFTPAIIVKPENRIPPTGNDSVEFTLGYRATGDTVILDQESSISDNDGIAMLERRTIDEIPGTTLSMKIKGISHLSRSFDPVMYGPENTFTRDLRYLELKAGDTHPGSDDYVNSLDFSYSINNVYTSDLRADLNRDTLVNSLDFPTMISHIYEYGDE